MVHVTVEHLRRVANEVPDHLPLISAVYDKIKADSIIEGEYPQLTDAEWIEACENFASWVNEPSGIIWEAFAQAVMDVVTAREETE
jgi:hypothetical protein